MTAIYERQLSEIENKNLDLDSFIKTVEDYIKQEVEHAKNNISEVKVEYVKFSPISECFTCIFTMLPSLYLTTTSSKD
jgi:hypothetical protein